MKSEVVLRMGRLDAALLKKFEDYYHAINVDSDYLNAKWQYWQKHPDIVIIEAEKDHQIMGWIIYNPAHSTIEDILVNGAGGKQDILSQMADALIVRENLIAAEIMQADQSKYEWMLDYGFRPTRPFLFEGIPMLKMDLGTQVLLERLEEYRPIKEYREKQTVVLEQVAETQTDSEIKAALANLIGKLGGLDQYVKPGQSVVIKPNIVSDHGLKNGVYKGGIVTDPRLIKALVELLLPVAGKITIAEGSSINRSATLKQFAHYGYHSIVNLDPDKISLVDLNADKLVEKVVPRGKRMLSRKIPVTLEEADVIISVPVMKIHFAAVVSLSLKNLQGAVPPLEKYMSHFFGLWQNLVNISHLVKPQLIIIDGLTGQEDFGPISGTPKKMNLLIGGNNPVAVDAVTMRIMGIEPAASPHVLLAYLQGLGPMELDQIDLIGPSLEEVISPFKQPEIVLENGRNVTIHCGNACCGCRAYLHFVLSKLRKPDPADSSRLLIDRPLDKKVNIYLGPATEAEINPAETNLFMGICQQHHAEMGLHLPGCPPHAEVIINGIYSLFPDVEKAKYAEKSEEAALGEMLEQVLTMAK